MWGYHDMEGNKLAIISDENEDDNEKSLTIDINPALEITTTDIPNAIDGVEYSFPLAASGGTGVKVWTDRDGNLAGSGLTLSTGGILSGVATQVEDLPFTARVVDEVGAAADQPFTFAVDIFYICGDVDYDLVDVNVSDLTYFVDYMFAGGPPPPIASAADVNGSGSIDVSDITFLVDYLFGGGPTPRCQ